MCVPSTGGYVIHDGWKTDDLLFFVLLIGFCAASVCTCAALGVLKPFRHEIDVSVCVFFGVVCPGVLCFCALLFWYAHL